MKFIKSLFILFLNFVYFIISFKIFTFFTGTEVIYTIFSVICFIAIYLLGSFFINWFLFIKIINKCYKKTLKIIIILLLILIEIFMISGFLYYCNMNNQLMKAVEVRKTTYSVEDSQEIKNYFNRNRALFENFKDSLCVFNGYIDNDGYIVTYDEQNNQTKEWSSDISSEAIKYYNEVYFPYPKIEFGEFYDGKGIKFSFNYSSNEVIASIRYFENVPADIEKSNMYERLDSNWYLFVDAKI